MIDWVIDPMDKSTDRIVDLFIGYGIRLFALDRKLVKRNCKNFSQYCNNCWERRRQRDMESGKALFW